jgi:Cytochrome c7 and related cytochrome c
MHIRRIKLGLAVCCLISTGIVWRPLTTLGQQTPKPAAPAPAAPKPPPNYEKFTHQSHLGQVMVPNTSQTRELKCDSCHDRRDPIDTLVNTTDRNKRLRLRFPGHKACVDCHVIQFTARPQQTCIICHDTKGGLNARPPQRDFRDRYDFNAFFDAKQHELHTGYQFTNGKQLDCNYCHQPMAKPTSLGIASHPECYACHAPASGDAKASQKSGCLTCHTAQTPNPQPFSAKYVSRAYGALFTHKAHVGYVNNNCNACHTINGGYNQPTPTSIRIKEHLTPGERSGRGCFSCHDGGVHYGRKVFSGETDGGACNKCHTRADYKVNPSS